APDSTASRVSSSFAARGTSPAGKPLATDATLTPLPASDSFAVATRFGYTQTAATCGTDGSPGSGRIAFWQSWRTFPSESFPSRVVRSSIEIASLIPAILAVFLIERLASAAARSSIPTASTRGMRDVSKGRGSELIEPLIIGPGSDSFGDRRPGNSPVRDVPQRLHRRVQPANFGIRPRDVTRSGC